MRVLTPAAELHNPLPGGEESNAPPGRAAAPGWGTGADDKILRGGGIENDSTPAHDPDRCMTCLGVQPWTEARRIAAAMYAACSGRRIVDLPDAREVAARV